MENLTSDPKALAAIFRAAMDPNLKPGDFRAYVVLVKHRKQYWVNSVKVAEMAVEQGVCERALSSRIAVLERCKYIRVKPRGRGQSSVYILCDLIDEQDGLSSAVEDGCEDRMGSCDDRKIPAGPIGVYDVQETQGPPQGDLASPDRTTSIDPQGAAGQELVLTEPNKDAHVRDLLTAVCDTWLLPGEHAVRGFLRRPLNGSTPLRASVAFLHCIRCREMTVTDPGLLSAIEETSGSGVLDDPEVLAQLEAKLEKLKKQSGRNWVRGLDMNRGELALEVLRAYRAETRGVS